MSRSHLILFFSALLVLLQFASATSIPAPPKPVRIVLSHDAPSSFLRPNEQVRVTASLFNYDEVTQRITTPFTASTTATVDFLFDSSVSAYSGGCSAVALVNGVAHCDLQFNQLNTETISVSFNDVNDSPRDNTLEPSYADLVFRVVPLSQNALTVNVTTVPSCASGLQTCVSNLPTGTINFGEGIKLSVEVTVNSVKLIAAAGRVTFYSAQGSQRTVIPGCDNLLVLDGVAVCEAPLDFLQPQHFVFVAVYSGNEISSNAVSEALSVNVRAPSKTLVRARLEDGSVLPPLGSVATEEKVFLQAYVIAPTTPSGDVALKQIVGTLTFYHLSILDEVNPDQANGNPTPIASCTNVAIDPTTGLAECEQTFSEWKKQYFTASFSPVSSDDFSSSESDVFVLPVEWATKIETEQLTPTPPNSRKWWEVNDVIKFRSTLKQTATGANKLNELNANGDIDTKGKVTFFLNGHPMAGCKDLVPVSGVVFCEYTFVTRGMTEIIAVYEGDNYYHDSTTVPSLFKEQVYGRAHTQISISTSPVVQTINQAFTYKATVMDMEEQLIGDTQGRLTFSVSPAEVSSQPSFTLSSSCTDLALSGSQAGCEITFLFPGEYVISANFNKDDADPTWYSSTGETDPAVTIAQNTLIVMTTDAAPGSVLLGQPTVISAKFVTNDVNQNAVTVAASAGEMSFFVDGEPIEACQHVVYTANADRISCTYTFPHPRVVKLTAHFTGGLISPTQNDWTRDNPSAFEQQIRAPTAVSVVSDSDSNKMKQGDTSVPVTFTATVVALPSGVTQFADGVSFTQSPGTVSFYDGEDFVAPANPNDPSDYTPQFYTPLCENVPLDANGQAVCVYHYFAEASVRHITARFNINGADTLLSASISPAYLQYIRVSTVIQPVGYTTVHEVDEVISASANLYRMDRDGKLIRFNEGLVDFFLDDVAIPQCQGLPNVWGVSKCEGIVITTPGSHFIAQKYRGDEFHTPSDSLLYPVTVTIIRRSAVSVVVDAPVSHRFNTESSITFKANVHQLFRDPKDGAPLNDRQAPIDIPTTGTVNFFVVNQPTVAADVNAASACVNGVNCNQLICSDVPVDSQGDSSCQHTFTDSGVYQVIAQFSGQNDKFSGPVTTPIDQAAKVTVFLATKIKVTTSHSPASSVL